MLFFLLIKKPLIEAAFCLKFITETHPLINAMDILHARRKVPQAVLKVVILGEKRKDDK